MARRGKFGQAPRSAPDLSATLVAIASSMQSQRDNNIVDAWKNGGTFEGQPVTDERLLAYWRDREKNLDPQDPAYDTIKNTVFQYEYAIAQSRMATLYSQDRVTDTQMAQFYLAWAKKVPVNSEFYRQLQQDAAKFTQAAASKAAAGAAKAKQDAYNQYVTDTTNQYIGLGDVLTNVLTQVAIDNNLIGPTQGLGDIEYNPGRMEALIAALPGYAGWLNVVDTIRKYDPTFSGTLTTAYISKALANQAKGYGLLATRAQTDGYSSDVKTWQKSQKNAIALGAEANAWPVAQSYTLARQQFDAIWNNPGSTDADRAEAASTFADVLTRLAKTPGISAATANRLTNDAAVMRGDPNAADEPSFGEDFLGTKSQTKEGTSGGENVTLKTDVGRILAGQAIAQANPGMFVYAPSTTDPAGNPTLDPSGKGPVGMVPYASVITSTGAYVVVPVAGTTGTVVMEAVPAQDIIVDDPAHPGAKGTIVGKALTYSQNGHQVTVYGLQQADGTMVWTTSTQGLFAQGVSMTRTGDSIHLQPPGAPDPATLAKQIDSQYPGMNLTAQLQAGTTSASSSVSSKKGNVTTKITASFENGQFTVTQTVSDSSKGTSNTTTLPLGSEQGGVQAAESSVFNPSRLVLGSNPGLDYSTPGMAALASTGASASQLSGIQSDPVFQAEMGRQVYEASGGDANTQSNMIMANANAMRQLAIDGTPGAPTSSTGLLEWVTERAAGVKVPTVDTGAAGGRGAHDLTPSVTFANQKLKLPGVTPTTVRPAPVPFVGGGSLLTPPGAGGPTQFTPQGGKPTAFSPSPAPPKPTIFTPTPTSTPSTPLTPDTTPPTPKVTTPSLGAPTSATGLLEWVNEQAAQAKPAPRPRFGPQ